MEKTREEIIKKKKKKKQLQTRCSQALCCTCRPSVSSSEEAENSNHSGRFQTISSVTHAMVQERLDQMIRESQKGRHEETKFVLMVAMEMSSDDPRGDFRESMEEMIVANRIEETKDLRRLLNYYVSLNSEEFRDIILEAFHEVCTDLFVFYRV